MTSYDSGTGLHLPAQDPGADARLKRLLDLGLLEENGVPELDELAASLASETGLPYAMVNVLTPDEQRFAGLHAPTGREGLVDVGRTMRRDHGYCPVVLGRTKPLVLSDTLDYPRYAHNPVVDQVNIRTYVGARVHDPATGIALGTVCAVGNEPRTDMDQARSSLETIKRFRDDVEDLFRQRT